MYEKLERMLSIGSGVALLVLMLITVVDVVGRGLLNAPLPGAIELIELTLAVLTFTAYPNIAYRSRHIVIDLFDPYCSSTTKKVQSLLVALIGAAIFSIVAWRLWIQGVRSIAEKDSTGTLGVPIGYFLCGMAIMSVVTAIAFASQFRGGKASEQEKDLSIEPKF